jgi:hypothetical protein
MAQRKEKIEPEAIFLQAVNFHIASRTLQEWKPWHPSGARVMDMPGAVINAFSSELFLKALICIERATSREGIIC